MKLWKNSSCIQLVKKILFGSKNVERLNQPIWKICQHQIGSVPQVGMKITNIWNHHLEKNSTPTTGECPKRYGMKEWSFTYNGDDTSLIPYFSGQPDYEEWSIYEILRRELGSIHRTKRSKLFPTLSSKIIWVKVGKYHPSHNFLSHSSAWSFPFANFLCQVNPFQGGIWASTAVQNYTSLGEFVI